MPDFSFVTVTHPGDVKEHSTRIRRHVMKDIGKARRKPKAKTCQTTVIDETFPVTSSEMPNPLSSWKDQELRDALSQALRSPRSEGQISTMLYPFEMNEERLNLARYMVEEARYVYRPFRFAWLSMGLTDPASWHITLANAMLYRSLDLGSQKPEFFTNIDAMKYYTQSLESVTKRLVDSADSDSEGLVVAVTGFVCHDASLGNFERMDIHMKGLRRLVEKKGGLEKLTSPFLRLMISWFDCARASFMNTTPYFEVPKGSLTDIITGDDTKYLGDILARWDSQCCNLGDIMDAIRATAAVAVYINRQGEDSKFWRDDIQLARLLGPAYHEILKLEGRPLPDDPLDPNYSAIAAREALRRAALVFLAAIKMKCEAGAYDLPKHIDAFRQISRLPLVDWAVVPELTLWAHIIVAAQEESAERWWHVSNIASVVEVLELQSGEDAVAVAKGIIWIGLTEIQGLVEEIDEHLHWNKISQQLEHFPLDPQLNVVLFDPQLADIPRDPHLGVVLDTQLEVITLDPQLENLFFGQSSN